MNYFKKIFSIDFSTKSPLAMLAIMSIAIHFSFSTWRSLLNNFAVDVVDFSGAEMGILQALREVPGFLAFTAILMLYFLREQSLAVLSIIIMGFGVAITGYFPSIVGLYITTVIMSIGFHYYETMNQSLSLQIFSKDEAPKNLGKLIAVSSFAGLIAYLFIFVFYGQLNIGYKNSFLLAGSITILMGLYIYKVFPRIEVPHEQNKKLFLRKRYWLYYALTFMGGARRQIFVVFAGFLMVEKFGFSVTEIAALYFFNGVFNIYLAPKIGQLIGTMGERLVLTIEYVGLVVIFMGYGFVDNRWVGVFLFIADHAFFSMAIAQKTYFQKIADPKDFAPTAGVAFSINHIAAIGLPAVYGIIWVTYGASYVFFIGAAFAAISLVLARFIPKNPAMGQEFIWSKQPKVKQA
ncbi:MAG: MFS transporter [Rhizobiales bacterium]|nr:MFS transporter [Hyphomicrobiales bacterium]NRB13845.1 MFS transporter [Hyphomicrobiales bacterium]